MTNQVSPVVLFVYNRPEHTEQCLLALANNSLSIDTELIIYSDGAKNELDVPAVLAVRSLISTVEGFRTVKVVSRDQNWGLSKSIIRGVTEMLLDHESVIVLEDDLVTSPHFLKYMNDAIKLYRGNSNVASIHGYRYPVREMPPETFFLKGADCWGWATWRSAWACFREDGVQLLEELRRKSLVNRFDYNGSYPYSRMLKNQIAGRTDSWAIRWYASALLAGKYTLYPGQSLIKNIGMDGSGTHSESERDFESELAQKPIDVKEIKVVEKIELYEMVCGYFRASQPRILPQIFRRLRSLASRVLKT